LRFGFGAGCAFETGWGCVLRTASASISCSSALVGAEGFVILLLFFFQLRRFPGQALGSQSLIVFSEGFLGCLVFRCRLPFIGALKTPSATLVVLGPSLFYRSWITSIFSDR
jgi:hypothetical protein